MLLAAELYETSEVPPSIPPAGPSIDNTVMLMEHAVYHEPFCMLDVLWRVWRHGLDVAGLRLLYNVSAHPSEENTGQLDHKIEPSTSLKH